MSNIKVLQISDGQVQKKGSWILNFHWSRCYVFSITVSKMNKLLVIINKYWDLLNFIFIDLFILSFLITCCSCPQNLTFETFSKGLSAGIIGQCVFNIGQCSAWQWMGPAVQLSLNHFVSSVSPLPAEILKVELYAAARGWSNLKPNCDCSRGCGSLFRRQLTKSCFTRQLMKVDEKPECVSFVWFCPIRLLEMSGYFFKTMILRPNSDGVHVTVWLHFSHLLLWVRYSRFNCPWETRGRIFMVCTVDVS